MHLHVYTQELYGVSTPVYTHVHVYTQELGEAMRRIDPRVSQTEVELRFHEMDKDRDGYATREEFVA